MPTLAESEPMEVEMVTEENNSTQMAVDDSEEIVELTPVNERTTRKRKSDGTRMNQTTLLNFFKKK